LPIDQGTAAPRNVASANPAAVRPEANNPIAQSAPPNTPVRSDAKANQSTRAPVDSTASTVPPFPVAWRPFAAMVISGLAVPLAYLSRTATPALVSKALACLPGMDRQPKSLPTKSDV
jgi:hypothetical protein